MSHPRSAFDRDKSPIADNRSCSISLNYTVTPENPDDLTDGSLFLCPRSPSNPDFADGPLIISNTGEVIWDGTAEPYNFGQGMSFEPALYMGQQVIAFWQGQFFGGGYGDGYGLILNSSYGVIANVYVSPPSLGAGHLAEWSSGLTL